MKYASVLLTLGCFATTVHAQYRETTVFAGDGPSAICYNPQDNKVYCANRFDNSVTVISGANNRVLATVPAGQGPAGLCYNPTNDKVYCASFGSGDVTVIDGVTDTVIMTVATGLGATDLCHNPYSNRVYCSNHFAGTVTIIDGSTDKVIGDAFVHSGPWGLCYNSLTDEVYCTCSDSLGGYVTVVDGPHGSCDIALGYAGPSALIYDEQHNKVFCNGFRDSILVIDGAGDSVIGRIKVGVDPFAFCYNPRESVLYCANIHSKTATVINAATNTVVATIGVDSEPRALCYDSTHNKLYCANAKSDDVTVIDGAGDTVICTIAVGNQPWALAYNPLQGRVYSANWGSYNVTVIRDTSTGIEESPEPRTLSRKLEPTVLSGVCVQSLESKVIFDAMGRRVANPRSGIIFVQERSAASGEPSAVSVRKVVIPR
jgi:YVTN family beta-propeller protein